MNIRLQAIAEHINARVDGDAELEISAPASVEDAKADEIAFADGIKLLARVRDGQAGAVVVAPDFPALPGRNLVRVEQPRLAFLRVMELFAPQAVSSGVNPRAVVD